MRVPGLILSDDRLMTEIRQDASLQLTTCGCSMAPATCSSFSARHWSARKTREFFARETPHRAYVNRMRSIARADYVERLPCIDVPTLLLTPQEDRIIGKHAAGELLRGIRRSSEVVLAETGHMFRFSHPTLYARQVLRFLGNAAISAQASSGPAP